MKTDGELYDEAVNITDQNEADTFFALLVVRRMNLSSIPREEAEVWERRELGYFAGYYSHATRVRVERLFRCEHPYFGSIERDGPPTNAFAMGIAVGRALAGKKDGDA